MGGSPCKAWDWRNPIVQTLFTQGATRTAVLRPRRDSRNVGAGRPKAAARVGASQPPGVLRGPTRTAVLRARRDSRTNGRGCPSASARGSAVVPPGVLRGRRDSRNVGAGRPKAVARVGASQPPEPGLFRLWTAIYQRPASDPMGREGAADHAQAGQKRQRPAGGAAGGRSPPGRGLWPPPCSALRAERRPPRRRWLTGL